MGGPYAGRLVAVVGVVVVFGLGALGARWAFEETLSRHSEMDPASWLGVTIQAARHDAAEHDEEELVEAMTTMCQLEVNGRVDDDTMEVLGEGRYSFEVHPSLDEADRQQFEGCIEDLRIDHFRAVVEDMEHHPG
jgi:hypothetical protein